MLKSLRTLIVEGEQLKTRSCSIFLLVDEHYPTVFRGCALGGAILATGRLNEYARLQKTVGASKAVSQMLNLSCEEIGRISMLYIDGGIAEILERTANVMVEVAA